MPDTGHMPIPDVAWAFVLKFVVAVAGVVVFCLTVGRRD